MSQGAWVLQRDDVRGWGTSSVGGTDSRLERASHAHVTAISTKHQKSNGLVLNLKRRMPSTIALFCTKKTVLLRIASCVCTAHGS
eukprot:85613-Rhodomonas_salina.2